MTIVRFTFRILPHAFFIYSLFSRIGDTDEGSSGTVEGAKGVYSSSAANIDSSGKGTYSVKAGKIPG